MCKGCLIFLSYSITFPEYSIELEVWLSIKAGVKWMANCPYLTYCTVHSATGDGIV